MTRAFNPRMNEQDPFAKTRACAAGRVATQEEERWRASEANNDSVRGTAHTCMYRMAPAVLVPGRVVVKGKDCRSYSNQAMPTRAEKGGGGAFCYNRNDRVPFVIFGSHPPSLFLPFVFLFYHYPIRPTTIKPQQGCLVVRRLWRRGAARRDCRPRHPHRRGG